MKCYVVWMCIYLYRQEKKSVQARKKCLCAQFTFSSKTLFPNKFKSACHWLAVSFILALVVEILCAVAWLKFCFMLCSKWHCHLRWLLSVTIPILWCMLLSGLSSTAIIVSPVASILGLFDMLHLSAYYCLHLLTLCITFDMDYFMSVPSAMALCLGSAYSPLPIHCDISQLHISIVYSFVCCLVSFFCCLHMGMSTRVYCSHTCV